MKIHTVVKIHTIFMIHTVVKVHTIFMVHTVYKVHTPRSMQQSAIFTQ